jgi:hypothetical protein
MFFAVLTSDDLVLEDAMRCMNLSGGYMRFKRDIEERKQHAKEINWAIKKLFANITQPKFVRCAMEAMWCDMENDTSFGDLGPFVPIFVYWRSYWNFNRRPYITTLKRVFALIRPSFFVCDSIMDR